MSAGRCFTLHLQVSLTGKKEEYFERFLTLLETYSKILLVGVDNIGSHQYDLLLRLLAFLAYVKHANHPQIPPW